MKKLLSFCLPLALLTAVFVLQAAAQSSLPDAALVASINELAEKSFKPDEPGAAVIAVKNGQVVLRKGYGLANAEWNVPNAPDTIFRIGSVTKQFTAVAILLLMEQGKLALTDELTKFLPDYPTQGHKITVEHLLTHTSGIVSYTGLPEWRPQLRKDTTMKELIAVFKDKPMEFAPGTGWNYNNSAFVLLGAIIEQVSGKSYGEFVEQNIFAPLGMKSSFYDSTSRLIPRRASGYSRQQGKFVNGEYLSMSWPHAAGSLLSTVDDLALWDAALYTDKIVKQASLQRAWTPYPLNDRRSTKYGYGWFVSELEGRRMIQHGGGINGFTCGSLRLPDDRVYVAVLTNRDGGTGGLERKIAALLIGKELKDPVAIKLPATALDQYVGVYRVDEKREFVFTREGEKFFLQHPVFGKQEIEPLSETEFIAKANRGARLQFIKDPAGKVAGVTMVNSVGPDETASRTNKPLPKPKEAAAVDPAVLDSYVGEYEIAPGFILTVTREGDKLMGQATGQPKIEMQAESVTQFAIPQVNARIEFVVEGGKTTALMLDQGGRKMNAKKIK